MLETYQNIKKLRKEKGWTQTDLAKKVGYTHKSMIARIEAGKIDLPSSKIIEFAEVFGVEPGDLMGMDGVMVETIENQILYKETELDKFVNEISDFTDDEIDALRTYAKFIRSQR